MSGISLTTLYETQRSQLHAALAEHAAVHDALTALRQLFDQLPAAISRLVGEKEQDPDIASAQRPEQLALLQEALRAGIVGSLSSVRAAADTAPRLDEQPQDDRRSDGLLEKAGRLLSGSFRSQTHQDRPAVVDQQQPSSPTVDTARLLNQVRAAFEAADRVLAAAKPPPPKIVKTSWSDDTELLELFQDLLEAQNCDDGHLALSHVERLRRLLPQRHGVDVVAFDGANEDMFRFSGGIDPTDPQLRTVRPALVAAGRVLRKGEVCGPRPPDASTDSGDTERPDHATTEEWRHHHG